MAALRLKLAEKSHEKGLIRIPLNTSEIRLCTRHYKHKLPSLIANSGSDLQCGDLYIKKALLRYQMLHICVSCEVVLAANRISNFHLAPHRFAPDNPFEELERQER